MPIFGESFNFNIFIITQEAKLELLQKKTLKKAIVTGPKEYVAILILKKADAQIKANVVNKI